MKLITRSVILTVTSSLTLITLSFLVISLLSKSVSYALEQMVSLKYYILPLALGFGLQVTLFIMIKEKVKESAALVTSTGAISSGTMIACCAHHLTEALPFLSVGGLSLFFFNYQEELLILSIALNWVSVLYMYKKLRLLNAR